MISVLNTGFIICLSAAILFLIISVVLFFIFDIRTIFMIRSGRAQAKSVKEMQEANANTGRLRGGKSSQKKSASSYTSYSSAPISQPVQSDAVQQPADSGWDSARTEPLGPDSASDGSDDTVLLAENRPGYDDGAAETSVLRTAAETEVLTTAAETSVLSQVSNSTEVLNQTSDAQPAQAIYFEVIKKIICRDTDEVIR